MRTQLAAGVMGVNAVTLRQPLSHIAQQADNSLSTPIASVCSRIAKVLSVLRIRGLVDAGFIERAQ
jgi:hypothetical protein